MKLSQSGKMFAAAKVRDLANMINPNTTVAEFLAWLTETATLYKIEVTPHKGWDGTVKKIQAIKVARVLGGLGLKEAKELVEAGMDTPSMACVPLTGVSLEDAETVLRDALVSYPDLYTCAHIRTIPA